MCDTSWWAMMIHLLATSCIGSTRNSTRSPGKRIRADLVTNGCAVNPERWTAVNGGKMLGKWWENGGKMVKNAGNPMWLKLQLPFFVLKFFRKMENLTAWLCQLCPPNKWQILEHSKKVTCIHVSIPLFSTEKVTNQSCTSKCWTSQATIGIHQLSIQLSVSFWFGSVLVSGHMAVTGTPKNKGSLQPIWHDWPFCTSVSRCQGKKNAVLLMSRPPQFLKWMHSIAVYLYIIWYII